MLSREPDQLSPVKSRGDVPLEFNESPSPFADGLTAARSSGPRPIPEGLKAQDGAGVPSSVEREDALLERMTQGSKRISEPKSGFETFFEYVSDPTKPIKDVGKLAQDLGKTASLGYKAHLGTLDPEETEELTELVRLMRQKEERGTTMGSDIMSGLAGSAVFSGQFVVGRAAGQAALKWGAKKLGKELVDEAGKIAGKVATKTLIQTAAEIATTTAGTMAAMELTPWMLGYEGGTFTERTYRQMGVLETLSLTEAGELMVYMDANVKSFSEAMPAGFVSTLFTSLSEQAGEHLIGPLFKAGAERLVAPAMRIAGGKYVRKWLDGNPGKTYRDFLNSGWARKAGIQAMPTEYGEEVLEELLHATGIGGLKEGDDPDAYRDALIPGWRKFLTTVAIISGQAGSLMGAKKVHEILSHGDDTKPVDFSQEPIYTFEEVASYVDKYAKDHPEEFEPKGQPESPPSDTGETSPPPGAAPPTPLEGEESKTDDSPNGTDRDQNVPEVRGEPETKPEGADMPAVPLEVREGEAAEEGGGIESSADGSGGVDAVEGQDLPEAQGDVSPELAELRRGNNDPTIREVPHTDERVGKDQAAVARRISEEGGAKILFVERPDGKPISGFAGVFAREGYFAVDINSPKVVNLAGHELAHNSKVALGIDSFAGYTERARKSNPMGFGVGMRKIRADYIKAYMADGMSRADALAQWRSMDKDTRKEEFEAAHLEATIRMVHLWGTPQGKKYMLQAMKKDPGFVVSILDAIIKMAKKLGVKVLTSTEKAMEDLRTLLAGGGASIEEVEGVTEGSIGAAIEFREMLDAVYEKTLSKPDVEAKSGKGKFGPGFHGTPHKFDKFSTDKIGTGEGVQAYGWGIYIASKQGVAQYYKEQFGSALHRRWSARFAKSNQSLQEELDETGGPDLGDMALTYATATRETFDFNYAGDVWADLLDRVVAAIEAFDPLPAGTGLKVELAPKETDYLLWDEPLSKQSETVKKAISKAIMDNPWESPGFTDRIGAFSIAKDSARSFKLTLWVNGAPELVGTFSSHAKARRVIASRVDDIGITGGAFQVGLKQTQGQSSVADKVASQALLASGIRGIKYLDGPSRNKPLRQVKADFLAELPEDADFDEVMELAANGGFSPEGSRFLKALAADDWLGFDHPAQAISAALGRGVGSFDISQETKDAAAAMRTDSSYNYVLFDAEDIEITGRFAPAPQGGKPLTQEQVEAEEEAESGTTLDVEIDEDAWINLRARFSPAPKVGRIPVVANKELKGRKMFAFFADRMRVGEYAGLHDDGISIPLQGGAGYPFIVGQRGKAGWAFTDLAMFSRFAKRVDATDGIGVVTLFASGNVRGNLTFLKAYIAEVDAAIEAGRLSRGRFMAEANRLRRTALKSKMISAVGSEWKALWAGAWKSSGEMHDALAASTFEVRNSAFFGWSADTVSGNRGSKIGSDKLVGAGRHKGYGFPNISDMVQMMEEPGFAGLPYGTMVGAVQFEEGQGRSRSASELGVEEHLSYPHIIKGRGIGFLSDQRSVTEVVKSDKAHFPALRSASVRMSDVKFSPAPSGQSPPFFSALESAVSEMGQTKFNAGQLNNVVKKARGVTEEELGWVAWADLLDGKKSVTKDEVLEWLRANQVEVQESVLGEKTPFVDIPLPDGYTTRTIKDEIKLWPHTRGQVLNASGEVQNESDDIAGAIEGFHRGRGVSGLLTGPTQHSDSSLSLPGGENYRELRLVLPASTRDLDSLRLTARADNPGGSVDEIEAAARAAQREAVSFTGSHFSDTPNVLAWIRFNERVDANGGRMLFVEEFQSDWAKQFWEPILKLKDEVKELLKEKPEGYEAQIEKLEARAQALYDNPGGGNPESVLAAAIAGGMTEAQAKKDIAHLVQEPLDTEARPTHDEWMRLSQATENSAVDLNVVFHDSRTGLPDAPFIRGRWKTLAMKRAIKWAADNGFDSVGWTTGAQQVERYESELRKVVDSHRWEEREDYTSVFLMKDGAQTTNLRVDRQGIVGGSSQPAFEGKPLSEVVGKAAAKNILGSPSGEGGPLTIGGKGYEDLYDKEFVQIANKLGKGFGTRVERGVAITNPGYAKSPRSIEKLRAGEVAPEMFLEYGEGATVHSLPLTDDMRATVKGKGFSTFAPKFAPAPEEGTEGFKRMVRKMHPDLKNEDGSPKRMYRGTRQPKHATKGRLDTPSFTESPDVGSIYASDPAKFTPEYPRGASVGAYYLAISNPLEFPTGQVSFADYLEMMGYGTTEGMTDGEARKALNYLINREEGRVKAGAFKSELNEYYDAGLFSGTTRLREFRDAADYDMEDVAGDLIVDTFALIDAPITRKVGERLGADGVTHADLFSGAYQSEALLGKPESAVRGVRKMRSAFEGGDIEDAITVWRPFSPSQVKSAIGNTGAYDPAQDDIRYRPAPSQPVHGVERAIDSTPLYREGTGAKGWFDRWAYGEEPEEIRRMLDKKGAYMNQHNKRASQLNMRLTRAVKKHYGSWEEFESTPDIGEFDIALRGGDGAGLHKDLIDVASALRDHVDDLSQILIDMGIVSGALEAKVQENLGIYLTRSYERFDNPIGWEKKVPLTVRNHFKAQVRSMKPKWTDKQLDGYIHEILTNESGDTFSLLGVDPGFMPKAGFKNQGPLNERKNLSALYRALLGEYTDPRVNYARSISRVSSMIASHQFLEDIREAGIGNYFFTQAESNERGDFTTKIEADPSSVLYPLGSSSQNDNPHFPPLYTTKSLKDAMERLQKPAKHNALFRNYMAVNMGVKLGKTAFSVATQARNPTSNVFFSIAQNHWRMSLLPKSINAVFADLFGHGGNKRTQEYIQELYRYEIVDQSVGEGMLRDMLKDIHNDGGPQGWLETTFLKAVKGTVIDIPLKLYRAADDVFHVYSWENEKARYRKAHPEWSEEKVKQVAATITLDVAQPTYGRVPKAVKEFRRVPMVASFVSFQSEVVRQRLNTYKLIRKELKDPATRDIAYQRLAGTIFAMSAAPALAYTSMLLLGMTGDDDEASRNFVPDYAKHHRFFWLESGYVDLSYQDPMAYVTEPLGIITRAFFTDKDLDVAAAEAIGTILEPFYSDEILWAAATDIKRNQTEWGRKIWDWDSNSYGEIFSKISSHLWHQAFKPGVVRSGERISKAISGESEDWGRVYDLDVEASALLGVRAEKLDIPRSLEKTWGPQYRRELSYASGELNSLLRSPNPVSRDELGVEYTRLEERYRAAYDKVRGAVKGAHSLQVKDEVITKSLIAGGVAQYKVHDMMAGTSPWYILSSKVEKDMQKLVDSEYTNVSQRDITNRLKWLDEFLSAD